MGFYHDVFAGMPRDQVHGKLFVCYFGPFLQAFLRGLPVFTRIFYLIFWDLNRTFEISINKKNAKNPVEITKIRLFNKIWFEFT